MSYLEKKEIKFDFIVIEHSKENVDLGLQNPYNTETAMKKRCTSWKYQFFSVVYWTGPGLIQNYALYL